MIRVLHWLADGVLAFLALELALYWAPLVAVLRRSDRRADEPPELPAGSPLPSFIVLTPCRDGAACLPGFIKSFRDQNYPPELFRICVVADNCVDASAAVARTLGANVYERQNLKAVGKGNAINEVLHARFMNEDFNALVVLDVDDRVGPDFLRQAARYVVGGQAEVISCATYAKNPNETLYTHVGDLIQQLLRLHQTGRSLLGWDAVIYGSHGYVLTRPALERLSWHTTTGQIAEDMELRLRCGLRNIPVVYAPPLAVYNDVTAHPAEVRQQRMRWNSTYLPLIPHYIGPLLRQGLGGRRAAFEDLFGLLLLPSFANLFLYLSIALFAGAIAWPFNRLHTFTLVALSLWWLDIVYFYLAFHSMGISLGKRELKGFLAHLGLRAVALIEGLFFIHVKNWLPAPHGGD
jgi:cellulose synthase/poly-beta-1,6-N-acetylglucosamine synthase-like glycosyltransferase